MVKSYKQKGGDGYGYTAPIATASGAPLENHASYSHCGWDNARSAVPDIGRYMTTQFGGKRRRRSHRKGSRSTHRKQRGGACGCSSSAPAPTPLFQTGGGGGSGGYSTMLSNDLGKVHAGYDVRPCPAAPVPTQVGGSAAQRGGERSPLDLVSYPTGYGYSPSSVVSTSSAHYLDQQGYNKTCSGGARRSRKGHRKGSRKSHRKGSRSAHRKGSRSAHRKGSRSAHRKH